MNAVEEKDLTNELRRDARDTLDHFCGFTIPTFLLLSEEKILRILGLPLIHQSQASY
jgi:hypothetical protein